MESRLVILLVIVVVAVVVLAIAIAVPVALKAKRVEEMTSLEKARKWMKETPFIDG